MKEVIISIKPKYAIAIINGEKRIEFRKNIPNIENGTRCYIYATAPYKKVIGSFFYWGCIVRPKEELWLKTQSIAGIKKDDFDKYYKDREIAYGWLIGQCKALDPFPIEVFNVKRPPQSYQFINNINY